MYAAADPPLAERLPARAAGRELSLRSLSRIWAGFEEDLALVLGLGLVGWEADQEPRAALAFLFQRRKCVFGPGCFGRNFVSTQQARFLGT